MQLYYKSIGEGPPLFILHGLFGSGDNWQTLAREFSTHFKVFLVDQRNHGHSPHAAEMNYDVMAADLFGLLAQTGVRDVYLLGHSMGGKTVMRFAQQYGFLVQKMVVADIGMKEYPSHHEQIFKGLRSVDLNTLHSRGEVETALARHITDETTLQFIMKGLYWKVAGQLAWRFNWKSLEFNMGHILSALPLTEVPTSTLFLRGEHSRYITQEDEKGILQWVPNSEIQTIPGAGHWLHADAPALFKNAVEAFLLG